MMRWGLVPAKIADPDEFKILSTTNARSESILDKPIWRGPFAHRLSLVPVDGFYEWLQRPSLPSAATY
jgi:putative SOS response-associated peptidase YedK